MIPSGPGARGEGPTDLPTPRAPRETGGPIISILSRVAIATTIISITIITVTILTLILIIIIIIFLIIIMIIIYDTKV